MVSLSNKAYSDKEEWLNSITHGLGFIFAVYGLIQLIIRADNNISLVSSIIYGSSLILMFATSTIYHSVSKSSLKVSLKLLDHSAIYILIAGTYTPFMLVALDNWVGILGIIIIWSIAIIGLVFKWKSGNRFPKVSLILYLLMGWLIIMFLYPLSKIVEANALWLLLAGGMFFSVGVLFYTKKSIVYTHAIWHCFVIAGCACHFMSIYMYIV